MSSHNRPTNGVSRSPRAVIHKNILDAARSQPDASIEELAAHVQGASTSLVSRVLEKYGDPKENDQPTSPAESETNENPPNMSHQSTNGASNDVHTQPVLKDKPELEKLTDKQIEVLQGIRKRPKASQRDLADQFDLSQSTINNRLNNIDGFTWEHRREFVESVLETESTPQTETTDQSESPTNPTPVQSLEEQIIVLTEQVSSLDRQIGGSSSDTQSPFCDPDLAYKIVRACMNSDHITEDEADRILKAAITSPSSST